MSRTERFTGRQITVVVVAIAVAIISFPVGVYAAAITKVGIVDPSNTSRVAHVSGGKLEVGDGSGALTVNGTVLPYDAATVFTVFHDLTGGTPLVKSGVPAGSKIMITSITASNFGPSPASADIQLQVGADANCQGGVVGARTYSAAMNAYATVAASFPTPLVTNRCAVLNMGDAVTVTVTGYIYP
jgi:hypothetical protein